jgi:HPt (histidine-containing phosphotransfer) domain-containing protein
VATFLRVYADVPLTLLSLRDARTTADLEILCHNLTSSAGILGARTLQGLAHGVEHRIRTNDPSWADLVGETAEESARVLAFLRDLKPLVTPGDDRVGPALGSDEARRLLDDLARALAAHQVSEGRRLVSVLRAGGTPWTPELEALAAALGRYDFDTAARVLRSLTGVNGPGEGG